MNIQKVNIVNGSSLSNIYVYLSSPEDANVPSITKSLEIHPNSFIDIAYQDATANMFVWKKDSDVEKGGELVRGELVWQGIVPTKVQKSIFINPDEKKVIYDGTVLPDNFKTVTSLNRKKDNWSLYFFIMIIVVIIIFGFLLLSGKIKIL